MAKAASEYAQIKTWVHSLLEDARNNEHRLRKFQKFELRLLECGTLPKLLRLLSREYHRYFDSEAVSLLLLDPEYEIRRLLAHGRYAAADDYPLIQYLSENEFLVKLYEQRRTPILGTYSPRKHGALFPGLAKPLASICLVPLVRSKALIGSLNLGSSNVERYSGHSATDFLQHLAAVISVCLETAVFRERLKVLGLTDGLTGVNNRRFFDQRLLEEIARASRDNAPLSCLFIDLDHFKKINDTYGHKVGDDVLKITAQLIRAQLRTVDIVARYGGEEFAVLLTRTGLKEASEIATRIRKRVESFQFSSPFEPLVQVTTSIGVATLEPKQAASGIDRSAASLIERADRAVYRAKAQGRNCVVLSRHNHSLQGVIIP